VSISPAEATLPEMAATPGAVPRGPQSVVTTTWLVLGIVAAVALYAAHTFNASVLIDGLRWFWMDDDMMISMRYARNLAEDYGLVWNPGERVEGYTNFGWVMIMAAVHLLPLPDQLMPVAMRVVSAGICCGMLLVAARLLRTLEPRFLVLTLPVALVLILSCTDVMFWAVSGYETILVTLLHMLIVWRAVSNRRLDAALLIPLALLPLVRSDAMVIWLGDALLVMWLATDRRRAALLLAAALVPFACHLGFRLLYYGELLPNTYYLKLVGLDDRISRGLTYVLGFAERYALLLVLAAGTVASLWKRDIRTRSFVTTLVPAVLYAGYIGGDVFSLFRFFAHVMPELIIWAVIGAVALVRTRAARAAWLIAPLAVVAWPRLVDPVGEVVGVGQNGDPLAQTIVSAQLIGNASPDASVAVIPAGIVPYFTRLYSVDLLGKSDAYIARLPPTPGALNGHGKLDPSYSLGELKPDYIVSVRPEKFSTGIAPLPGTTDYVYTILASPEFQTLYKPNPVPDPYLLAQTAVYIRTGSPEIGKLKTWWGVILDQ
jgi:hypothetical protein